MTKRANVGTKPCATSPTAEAMRSERIQSEFESPVAHQFFARRAPISRGTPYALSSEAERPAHIGKVGVSKSSARTNSPASLAQSARRSARRAPPRHGGGRWIVTTILSRSSKAELAADNRANTARYRAGQPIARARARRGFVAQPAERRPFKSGDVGSNPTEPTTARVRARMHL